MQRLVAGGLAAAQAARPGAQRGEPAPPPMASPPATTTLEEVAGDLTASLDRLDEQAASTALDRLFSTGPADTSAGTGPRAGERGCHHRP
jgi:hypothetical protein